MSPALAARMVPQPVTRSAHIPAPVRGINTIAALSEMPPDQCPYAWNVLSGEYGMRVRQGFQEWCTGLTGAADARVPTTLPFVGSHANGSTNKLFAVTQSGIWDVTASSASPTRLVTFGTQTGDAGNGIATIAATPAGRFLLYCDEVNGLYVYTEGGAWAKIALGITQSWAPSFAYLVGDKVANGANTYVCTVAGTSASSGGPTGTGTGIVDGAAHWDWVAAFSATAIGPSLADQRAGFGGNPANFAHVMVWKSRVWLVEKDSTRGWYLSTNAIYGTATSFDFGSKMRAGGPLAGLYNWTPAGGSTIDTLLVAISTSGDVVIFAGTDPTSPSTFGIVGAWYVGGVPYGRRIATDYGGDLLILSLLGVIPLSRLYNGTPIDDRKVYETADIANLFNILAGTNKTLRGWSIRVHPTENALLITVPVADGQPTQQLVMSFATRGWTRYRDLPLLSAEAWDGQLYFGTHDGRVCVNSGYVDGVSLADPNSYSSVNYSVLFAFQTLGNSQQKRVHGIRTHLLSQTPNPLVQPTAKFDFDIAEPAPPAGSQLAPQGTWDNAKWDVSNWGGDYSPSNALYGATGVGRAVAIAIRGSATSRTVLVGVDVLFEQGGVLG